ncbi:MULTISPECIES: aldehyde dehydrogenase family protein [unclassified Pseudofrankia]|uniref:aldehyde dehydrogenase family protein n=1 Tax=unclassified Pseudofrankia TaxID=2994372 RepID=UPI0008DA8518|nr:MULTISPECIES: aldehyde dehydrogenase family protein [unclassified Pseudofrankia]MDT3444679.1 aldehyde dehydrogenase family protein [Pseudofrankia sp. BMG5.37]OHV66580.1 aldehyde dehydrogenase [Pseudofrankia sp. BMG5.36]
MSIVGVSTGALTGLAAGVSLTVDGRPVPGAGTFEVVNPATGERFADAPDASRAQVDAVMESAARAFVSWRADDAARCAALRAAADALEASASELALLLTAEQGKPFSGSLAEVSTSATWLRWYADLDLSAPEMVEDGTERTVTVHRRPLGVAVAICAWNFPIQMAMKKAAQALRPGNTLVIKPSPYTPFATLKAVEVLQSVFPPGVVSAVSGGGSELGGWLTSHPLTRKVTFTGSTATGKLVAAAVAPDLKRATLELGGNDPAIVLDDADPALIGQGLFDRAFVNCGQTCAAIKRVYVHERLFDDVVDSLAGYARNSVVGNGMEPGTEFGPLNNRAQLEIVTSLVDDALSRGARAVTGGTPIESPGYFYPPTILTGVEDGMAVVDQEQFGPVLPVLAYTHLDDALGRANRGPYGLGGSVWTSDEDRGRDVAARLEVGTAWVNTHAITTPSAPFAGAKWSGIGIENGIWGMHEFTQIQTIHTAH